MIQPIFIDTKQLTSQFDLTRSEVDSIIDTAIKKITVNFYKLWENEANVGLRKTRRIYVSQLKIIDEGRMKGSVLLDYTKNPVVRMVEEGANAFDLKLGFSRSSKVKYTAKGGWYLTIPFRVATPGAIGEASLFANIMPQEVYEIAKEKEQNINMVSGGIRSKGLTPQELMTIPSKYKLPQTRPGVSVIDSQKTFEEYKHKSSIYQGISKINDPKTGQNIYMNFRRVSSNSDLNSWIHTGILARNYADKAIQRLENNLEKIIGDVIDDSLDKLGF